MIVALMLACSGPRATDSGSVEVDSGQPIEASCELGWNSWASGFFTTYCTSCHHPGSANRHGAPVGIDLHTQDDAMRHLDRVRARVLIAQDMPLGGGVPMADLQRLNDWVDCAEAGP